MSESADRFGLVRRRWLKAGRVPNVRPPNAEPARTEFNQTTFVVIVWVAVVVVFPVLLSLISTHIILSWSARLVLADFRVKFR